MPARPMPRSPHKKVSGWSRGYHPEFGRFPHHHNDQGNTPPGRVKKMSRFRTQPPGYPQGVHLRDPKHGEVCLCGGCFEKNIGLVSVYSVEPLSRKTIK